MTLSEPKISIVMPVYNCVDNLPFIVSSIINQTFDDFELIAVNDGSIDNSAAFLDAIVDSRVRVYHKANGGVSSARNMGLEQAKGEYICFCDADDNVENNWLEQFASQFERETDIVVSGFKYVNPQGCTALYIGTLPNNPFIVAERLSRNSTLGYLWCKCFKADIIRENNLKFDERHRFMEDEEFIVRFWKYVKTVSISDGTSYLYNEPNYEKKYSPIDNYEQYRDMLLETAKFVKLNASSVMLKKYTMGCFRCMMLSFKKHEYRNGWNRLKEFAFLSKRFKANNKYMCYINRWNYPLWYPVMVIRNL